MTDTARVYPSQERLRELFHYDACAGQLIRKVSIKKAKAGDVAGYVRGHGYLHIDVDGVTYRSHRLIYLYVHGHLPKYIDHIDGNRINNRIENLRPCTNSQNQQNKKKNENKRLPKNIYFEARRQMFYARLSSKFVGYFKSLEDAKSALYVAGKQLHGEFYRAA